MSERLPIVMVHGIRNSSTMWRHQVETLRERGHTVDAIDLPGHGTRIGERFTIDGAIGAIDDAIAAQGGQSLLVGGFSLGGYLTIEYTARHPERVAGLVAASCCTRPLGLALTGYRLVADAIMAMPDRGLALNNLMTKAFLPRAAAEDVLRGGVALDVMPEALDAVGRIDPLSGLQSYDGPVWLVNGELDHFRIEERRFLAACRRGRLTVIRGGNHMVSLTKPNAFTNAVLRAANEIERTRTPIVGSTP